MNLEAGTMILLNWELVYVDKSDKIAENNRVTIHETMTQLPNTISKADMYASLNKWFFLLLDQIDPVTNCRTVVHVILGYCYQIMQGVVEYDNI